MFESVIRNPNHAVLAGQPEGRPAFDDQTTHASSNTRELLTPLDKARYPDVKYWRKNEWNRRPTTTTVVNAQAGVKGRQRRAAGINVNCGFVEDEDGIPVDGYRVTAISNRFREVWRECHSRGIAPPTWGKGSATFRDFVRIQMYKYASELRLCEDHWKLDFLATMNYPGWYRKHVLGEDSDKEDGGNVDKENRDKNNDDYMHLPQKRGSTAVPQPSKKKKKLKIPVSVKTAAIDPAQIPTPPATASSGNCSAASTPFASSVDLPALSEIASEQGHANPLEDPPAFPIDVMDTQMLDDVVNETGAHTKGTETQMNRPDYVDAPTEPDMELPVPPTTREDKIPQPQAPLAAVPAPAPLAPVPVPVLQDPIGVEQPLAAVPAPAPLAPVPVPVLQGPIGVEQPLAAVPAPAPLAPVVIQNPL